jgi:hypothetical protein
VLITTAFCNSQSSGNSSGGPENGPPPDANPVNIAFAETFKVYERDSYRIVDLRAPLVT